MDKIADFRRLLENKFIEIAGRILGDDELAEVDYTDLSAEDLARVRVPFRTWLSRAGIGRRDVDWSWNDPSRYKVEGHACIGDFTMKGESAVLDIPMALVESGVLPEVVVERKKHDGPIVRGSRNSSSYEVLAGVGPSEDGKRIVFRFQNGTTFSWNIVDKKFYHGNNGAEFAQSHFGNINWGEARPGRPSFFEYLYKTADEGWVKNLFAILSNWVKNRVDSVRREGAYRLHEKRLNRLETMCNPDVIGPIESLAKNNFVDRMNLDRVCQRVFVGGKILAFGEIKEKYALDAWFLKNSGERIHPQYCRDERYIADGQDIYAEDNREWILGNYMEQYRIWVRAGLGEVFRHVWDNYRFVFPHGDWQMARLKETMDQLKGYGYDLKRVMDYLFRDLPMQGLCQKMASHDVPHEMILIRDYAKMMVEMDRKYDRYPKSLKMCHDIAAKNYRVQQSQILAKKYEGVREGLKKMEWQGEQYAVIVPPTMQSVVQEGASLNHCVASYVDGMVNGEYAILFLRKKEELEKSLVTLQVRDGRVVQARGQSNRAPTKEEQEAIDLFSASLEKQKELEMSEAA